MTMVKPLFLPTVDAIEQSFVLSSTIFKDVLDYCSGKFTTRIRHPNFHKELVCLESLNVEMHAKLKVAVDEVNRLNRELKSVTTSSNFGAVQPNTTATKTPNQVTPKPDKCPSTIFATEPKASIDDGLWESDDSDVDPDPPKVPFSNKRRYNKHPKHELPHCFVMINGWLTRVVPAHKKAKTSDIAKTPKKCASLQIKVKREEDRIDNKKNNWV